MGAGGLVLDQHDIGLEQVLLVAYGALERGVSSRRRKTARRKRCLPLIPQVVHTLKSLSSVALLAVSQLCTTRSKSLRPFVLAIALEPFRLDQAATQGRRGLLILASEIVFPD